MPKYERYPSWTALINAGTLSEDNNVLVINLSITSLQESKHLYLYFTELEDYQFREMLARLAAINQTDTSNSHFLNCGYWLNGPRILGFLCSFGLNGDTQKHNCVGYV